MIMIYMNYGLTRLDATDYDTTNTLNLMKSDCWKLMKCADDGLS